MSGVQNIRLEAQRRIVIRNNVLLDEEYSKEEAYVTGTMEGA